MTRQMLVLELCCPQCGAALTEGTRVRLDGHVRRTHEQREIALSAVFGDDKLEADPTLEESDVVDLSCPEVRGQPDAAAGLQDLRRPHGVAQHCQRRRPGVLFTASGCKAHAFGGTGNIDDMMSLMNRMFETPYD